MASVLCSTRRNPNLQCLQWLQEELKRPSDFVARATLSPSHIIPPTMCSAALFFKPFLWRIARLRPWSHYPRRHRDSIARLEQRCVARGGDLIGVTGRGEPLQLWMNFWFELTERRSVENTDRNGRKMKTPRGFLPWPLAASYAVLLTLLTRCSAPVPEQIQRCVSHWQRRQGGDR